MPFGSLYVFNEETLAGSQSLTEQISQSFHIIILPITGAVNFCGPEGKVITVEVEKILRYTLPANSTFTLTNPYEKDLINFLQIWIKAKEPVNTNSTQLHAFSFDANKDILATIVSGADADKKATELPFTLSIGRFGGRQETLYKLGSKNILFFGFVIAGAFEAEGRLLHEKDGLALWDITEVELEALSNNALMLTIELQHLP